MKIALHWKILIGMALGTLAGLGLFFWLEAVRPAVESAEAALTFPDRIVQVLDLVGQLFIRMLKMVVVPLIISTMISGVLSLGNFKKLGRMGARTLIYYLSTTGLSVLLGLILVNLIKPGAGAGLRDAKLLSQLAAGTGSWTDLVLSLVPANPIEAMAKTEVLPVIVFSLLFGAALLSLDRDAGPLAETFHALARAMMRLTEWVIRLAPYGVFALMAMVIVQFGWKALLDIAKYMLTVGLGLAIHFFLTLPLIAYVFGRYSPLRLIKDVSGALLMAFSSASSSATLPLTMANLEKNTGVSPRTTSFVLPLGATINMDGTALYEAVAAVFIAQAYGIHLTLIQMIIIFITASLAAIGAAAIPSAGLFTMAIVLNAVGLPLEGIGLILGVDRLLDMMRTATNVWGDCVGTVVIARLEGQNLAGDPSSISN